MSVVSTFIKYQRKKLNLTQADLAEKAGVGIRFIREMEQGKETLKLNKVNQVLSLFGFSLTPNKQENDPYNIRWNFFNQAVKITLNNNMVKYGIIIKEIIDPIESKITAWKFVPNNNAIRYRQKADDTLTEVIIHADIKDIELQ